MFYYLVLIIFLSNDIIDSNAISPSEKRLVCVIGAGVAGLTSIKQLADYPEFQVIAFEKSSGIGGLWNYTESVDLDENNLPVHSSMYKNLR